VQDLRFRANDLREDAKLTARQEVDRVFGEGYAAAHPELAAAILIAASIDLAAVTLAAALVEGEQKCLPSELVRSLHVPR
jgi:hypothetical protein